VPCLQCLVAISALSARIFEHRVAFPARSLLTWPDFRSFPMWLRGSVVWSRHFYMISTPPWRQLWATDCYCSGAVDVFTPFLRSTRKTKWQIFTLVHVIQTSTRCQNNQGHSGSVIRDNVINYSGNRKHLLTAGKSRKLARFGHVNRHDTLSKTSYMAQFNHSESRRSTKELVRQHQTMDKM
jgi:hypothetical protein